MSDDLYRRIPAIDRLLGTESVMNALSVYPRKLLVQAMRETAAKWRKMVKRGDFSKADLTEEKFIHDALSLAEARINGPLRPVINATGIILNTNLGRAPLSSPALVNLRRISGGYSNLEFDLEKGERGQRHVHAEEGLRRLTGAKSALVVNNNAAAVLLILDTFAKRKEVVVSRGELIEIGGSFRLPDVLKKSGAKLVEVGTTNRTYISDYEKAITDKTAILLKSHTSNYRVIGFVHRPPPEKLVRLAGRRKVMCVEDLGSGLLVDLREFGLDEPTVPQAVKTGMDIVTFSGDKLLGGPQCGIILGKTKYIKELRSNPLMRALRVDKMTLSVLCATLQVYLYSDAPLHDIPHLRMIAEPESKVKARARRLSRMLGDTAGFEASVIPSSAAVGGGSCPGLDIRSWAVRLKPKRGSALKLSKLLRKKDPPVIATLSEDGVNLDMRTVLPHQMKPLVRVLQDIAV